MDNELMKEIIMGMKNDGKLNSEIMQTLKISYATLRKIIDGDEK